MISEPLTHDVGFWVAWLLWMDNPDKIIGKIFKRLGWVQAVFDGLNLLCLSLLKVCHPKPPIARHSRMPKITIGGRTSPSWQMP